MTHTTIEIRSFLARDHSPEAIGDIARRGWVKGVVFADDVIGKVEAARRSGVGTLIVVVEGPGGHLEGARAVYDALRRFSDEGGRVITVLAGPRVASSAPLIALAGDWVLAVPGARVQLHSVEAATPGEVLEENAWNASILWERTAMPRDLVTACVTTGGLDEEGAARVMEGAGVELYRAGLADIEIGGLDFVPLFARALDHLPLPKRHEPGGALWRLQAMRPAAPRGVVATAAITADKIAAHVISADKIAAGELKTSNYAEDGSGNPTAGAKLDHQGTALKVAPANLQIGKTTIGNTWFAGKVVYTGWADANGGAYSAGVDNSTSGVTVSRVNLGPGYGLRVSLGARVPSCNDFTVMLTPVVNSSWAHVQPVLFGIHSPTFTDFDIAFRGTSSGNYNDPSSSNVLVHFTVTCIGVNGVWG